MLLSALSCFIAVIKKAWILLVKETRMSLKTVFLFLPQVALHACGVATDMVMEHCIQAGAAFVISPCCYGFIQNAVKFTFPKRFVPAHLSPMSPLRGSAFLNVVSDLGFSLNTSRHRGSSCLTFSSTFFESRLFFFASLSGGCCSISCTSSYAYTHRIFFCFHSLFFITTNDSMRQLCHNADSVGMEGNKLQWSRKALLWFWWPVAIVATGHHY